MQKSNKMVDKTTVIPINQDEISHYLKDLRKIKVMTPEREKELSIRIQTPGISDREKEKIQQSIVKFVERART